MSEKLNNNELYLTIDTIQRRKRTAGIVPDHCLRVADLFKELKKYPTSEIDAALRELKDAGRIEAGGSISDTWIKTK